MPRRAVPRRPTASAAGGYLPILLQRSAWGTCIGQACINYYLYFLVTWLPFYLVRGRHLAMSVMARDGGLLFVMYAIAAVVWGKLADRWIGAGASTTVVRKGGMAVGCTGFGISLVLTTLSPEPLFTWMLVPTGLLLGISCCASWAIPQTLAGPEMVGRWTGLQNFVGNLGGAAAPALTGYLLDKTGRFAWPFYITAGVAWVGALAWIFAVGPIEQVDWSKGSSRHAVAIEPAVRPSLP
jgi:MFS transporter, ACS family, D-galactonate transporter